MSFGLMTPLRPILCSGIRTVQSTGHNVVDEIGKRDAVEFINIAEDDALLCYPPRLWCSINITEPEDEMGDYQPPRSFCFVPPFTFREVIRPWRRQL